MVISLRRSNVSGSPQIYVINTYAKIQSRNQMTTYLNVICLAGNKMSIKNTALQSIVFKQQTVIPLIR